MKLLPAGGNARVGLMCIGHESSPVRGTKELSPALQRREA